MDRPAVAAQPQESIVAIADRPPCDDMTDAELLARFVEQGEQAAFEVVVRRHAPMILGVCRRMLRDEHAAEDALQAVFVVLLRKAAAIARPDLLANWLYGVAFRIARKARNKAGREQAGEILLEPADEPDLRSGPERREINAVLDEELNLLPARYRLPLVICYLDGKTHVEAARLLGCPCGSVADRLARGRAELRRRLLRRGLVLSAGFLLSLLRYSRASAAVGAAFMENVLDRAINRDLDLRGSRRPANRPQGDASDSGDSAKHPHADGESPAIDNAASRKRRRSRAVWPALLCLSVMLWIMIPAYELAGATVAYSWGAVPRLWTQLRTAFSAGPEVLSRSDQDGSMFGTPEGDTGERHSAAARRRLSAAERCKRCLGTQCGNEGDVGQVAPLRTPFWKRVLGR